MNISVASISALIVEDSAIFAERLSEMLMGLEGIERAGVFDTEAGAIGALRDREVDVVLLDLKLREGRGFGVLREIARYPQRPVVVVLTNYCLDEFRHNAQKLGAQHFLDKVHDMELLPKILSDIRQQNLRKFAESPASEGRYH